MSCWLTRDALVRLHDIESTTKPRHAWPKGCYGAARAWMVFVGPSPGGSDPDEAGWALTLHNEPFREPFAWVGFRTCLAPLLESITGLPLDQSEKLFSIANFDFRQQSKAERVTPKAMDEGVSRVLRVLSTAKPRLILPMYEGACSKLITSLQDRGFGLASEEFDVNIPIPPHNERFHRRLMTWRVAASPATSLSGSMIAKLPQHPSHIFRRDYALGIGQAVHSTLQRLSDS